MSDSSLIRRGGASLLTAGIANAIFWPLVIQIRTFAGATASLKPLWVPSQLLHTLAAMLGLAIAVAMLGETITAPILIAALVMLVGLAITRKSNEQ
jgi:hypothetical protein